MEVPLRLCALFFLCSALTCSSTTITAQTALEEYLTMPGCVGALDTVPGLLENVDVLKNGKEDQDILVLPLNYFQIPFNGIKDLIFQTNEGQSATNLEGGVLILVVGMGIVCVVIILDRRL